RHVGLVLFHAHGLSRPPRPRRTGDFCHHPSHGGAWPLRTAARGHDRADWPLLALCRYRLDLPVPFALPGVSRSFLSWQTVTGPKPTPGQRSTLTWASFWPCVSSRPCRSLSTTCCTRAR